MYLDTVSKDGVISGIYFPVFGPEKTLYLDTFHAVRNPRQLYCDTSFLQLQALLFS